jgi:hypothetical protein
MAAPTQAEVLGANGTQDASTITIDKNDLSAYGLTPQATNSPEAIAAALVFLWLESLTREKQAESPLDRKIRFEEWTSGSYRIAGNQYYERAYLVYLRKPVSDMSISAGDF